MSRSAGFQFKSFYVRHDRCAMKVGTDGVLLGCWAGTAHDRQSGQDGSHQAERILDIGTGSGLVALMTAQRFPAARIDAIDIDAAAVEQARENFAASPWSDRLTVSLSRLQDWSVANGSSSVCPLYDLIISNPPYFQNSLKNPDKGREQARHTDSLSYEELIAHSRRLLTPEGVLALILPAEAEMQIQEIAARHSLVPVCLTRVYSKSTKPARRILIAFQVSTVHTSGLCSGGDTDSLPTVHSLVLENETGGRSAAYSELCKEFYL